MKLTVLGSGITISPPEVGYRYPSAHLIEVGGKTILLDAGLGALPQLYALGKNLRDLDAICISHFHADHFNIAPILQASFVHIRYDEVKPRLKICGPPGVEERMRTMMLNSEFAWDKIASSVDIESHEYASGKSIDLGNDIVLTPRSTQHFNLDAYALRIEAEGKSLAYSGDTTDCDGIRQAAKDADMLLCEAALSLDGSEADDGHVNPIGAAKIAEAAGAKHLVITHYPGTDSDEAMITAAEKVFDGKVSVSHDGEVIDTH